MDGKTPRSALEAISAELDTEQARRRAHFLPALLMSLVVVAGPLIVLGVRPDLLQLPPAQLAVQGLLWVLCLGVFPAIGVGLLFVGRAARLALAVTAVALSVVAATGWPFADVAATAHAHSHESMIGGCLPFTLGIGGLLLGIGVFSGAFVQRRRMAAVFWIAAGCSLVALNMVTWHCPHSGMLHVLPSHLGGAALLLALAVLVGVIVRRRQDDLA